MRKPIGVLGTGSFGTIIAALLMRNGQEVILWGRNKQVLSEISVSRTNATYLPGFKLPASPTVTTELSVVAASCDLIFAVVPASAMRKVMRRLGDDGGTHQIVVTCAKGLERKTFKRMTQVILDETPFLKVGVLTGPNLAREIAMGFPGATLIASQLDEVIQEVHAALNSPFFKVYGSHDPSGAEFCGSLKNIYAIASGVAKGLQFGLNARSFLLTKALKEMREFSTRYGAAPETFSGIAGVGDLIATAMSELSRNFSFGVNIADGMSAKEALAAVGQTVEGYHTVHAVYHFARKHKIRMPITEAVYSVVYRGRKIRDVVEKLLQTDVMYENELYR